MALLIGSLQQGIIYGIMVMGIFISFRILNIPDLTTEGSFTFGMAVSAMMTIGGHPYMGLVLSLLAGAFAGVITGVLQTKLNIHPVLAGILTMCGLYSTNLTVMNKSANITLVGSDTAFTLAYDWFKNVDKEMVKLIVAGVLALVVLAVLIYFFKTQLGLSIRATGDNADLVKASSINVDAVKITALALSNACIGFCGGVITQYQRSADINFGTGLLVVGLASVIIGEVICGKRGITIGFISAMAGSIIYRFIIAWVTDSDWFPAYMLRLVSSVIVAVALAIPAIKKWLQDAKIKRGGRVNA